jgi:hypothetical protein
LPSDVHEGQAFYNTLVPSLTHASQSFLNPGAVFQEGLTIIKYPPRQLRSYPSATSASTNYLVRVPTIRLGQSEGWEFYEFLQNPQKTMLCNLDMTPKQAFIAGESIDDSFTLGVVEATTPEKPVVADAPLFTLPKEGQWCQWSVLADMKLGQQNECIGSNPTVPMQWCHSVTTVVWQLLSSHRLLQVFLSV